MEYWQPQWEGSIRHTVIDGVPGWGSGRFHKDTAYLLHLMWIFGCCGLNRFYLGDIFWGIIYVLTFGCFGVGGCLDICLMSGSFSPKK
ncbi:hypothetical protein PAPYR_2118 [Paratrimastix pyriformis]|uniref:TM2 domain-containing protein n=1 Tax=Paratrimastix pyriformis TaxID=342808 RepID=A0ABQ8UQU8_9EUKA|nr:hypothetical protein PAPYR_2118 [Paratrimastix pyriformis]